MLLFVLFHIWTSKPTNEARRASSAATMIEATLAAAHPSLQRAAPSDIPVVASSEAALNPFLSPSPAAPEPSQHPIGPPATVAETRVPGPTSAPASNEKVAGDASSSPSSPQPPQAEPSQPAAAAQADDAPDPYAEMRRQRAEAEHRYQEQQQGMRAPSAAQRPSVDARMASPANAAAEAPFPLFAPSFELSPFLFGPPGFPRTAGVPVWTCQATASGSAINGPYVFDGFDCDPENGPE